MGPVILFLIILFSGMYTQVTYTSTLAVHSVEEAVANYTLQLYREIQSGTDKPNFAVFEKAVAGYLKLKASQCLNEEKNVLSIADFSLSANQERLWVIDLSAKKILFHTLVAHGRNTGEEYAYHFSNQPESYKSSLGFYVTGDTYQGQHGLSLYLDGQEKGFNDEARKRAIVIHGAHYVSQSFIERHGRLGRSLGCPALPMELHEKIIKKIAHQTCLFIYYPQNDYFTKSPLLNRPFELPTVDLANFFKKPNDHSPVLN